jgi:hypothetical protein
MLKGAFHFDVVAVESLTRIFESVVGKEYSSSYSVTMKNGSKYAVDSPQDLEKLPFSDVKSRDSFEMEWETKERPHISLKILVRYWRPALINISAFSDEHAERLAREVQSFVETRRVWYSWIFGYWVFGLLALPLYGALGLGVLLTMLPRETIVVVAIAYVSYGAFSGALYLARRFLFDSVIVEIGHEALRQASLARARSYLFGTLLVGALIAILGGASSAWFSN